MIYHPDNLTAEILEQKTEAILEQIHITPVFVQKAYRRHGIDTVYFYRGV